MTFKFIGIPYVPFETTFEGSDCWGLVVLYYREMYNIELPEWGDFLFHENFIEVSNPEEGDIVQVKGNHVGVMLDNRRMLHMKNYSGIERVDSLLWENKIQKYLRLNSKRPR